MVKGVIFDLDGVLVFTDKYHYLSWKKIADEEGIYFDETINDRLRGVSRMDSLNIILERSLRKYSSVEKEALAERKNNYYKEYLSTMTPKDVSKDAIYTLKELKKRGIKIAIGSSSKNTRFILDKVGLTEYFDAIVDGNMISKSKPDPEVFLKAAELIGVDPLVCVVVEDAVAGIQAAERGHFISVATGDAILSYLKDNWISNIKELLDIVK